MSFQLESSSTMCKWRRSSLTNLFDLNLPSARLISFHIIITSSLFIDSSWENDEQQRRHEKAFMKCKVDGQQHCAVDVSNTLRLSKPIISLHAEWLNGGRETENYPFVLFRFRSMCNFRIFFRRSRWCSMPEEVAPQKARNTWNTVLWCMR